MVYAIVRASTAPASSLTQHQTPPPLTHQTIIHNHQVNQLRLPHKTSPLCISLSTHTSLPSSPQHHSSTRQRHPSSHSTNTSSHLSLPLGTLTSSSRVFATGHHQPSHRRATTSRGPRSSRRDTDPAAAWSYTVYTLSDRLCSTSSYLFISATSLFRA